MAYLLLALFILLYVVWNKQIERNQNNYPRRNWIKVEFPKNEHVMFALRSWICPICRNESSIKRSLKLKNGVKGKEIQPKAPYKNPIPQAAVNQDEENALLQRDWDQMNWCFVFLLLLLLLLRLFSFLLYLLCCFINSIT